MSYSRVILRKLVNAGSIVRYVWTHPASQGRRLRSTARSAAFEVANRSFRYQPTFSAKGIQMVANRRHDSSVRAFHCFPPDYSEMLAWQCHLKPGDLFIDVGANVGVYTLWAAKIGCDVIALEPDAAARRSLKDHLTLNEMTAEVLPLAAGAQPGSTYMTSAAKSSTNRIGAGSQLIKIETLDHILGSRYAAGLKIDVEGAERLVLEGLTRALRDGRIGLIQLEWNGLSHSVLGEGREPVAEILSEFGYQLYYATGVGSLKPIEGIPAGVSGAKDIFAALPNHGLQSS